MISTVPTNHPDSDPHFMPLYRHPLIWVSAILWGGSLLLLVVAALAAVVAAVSRMM